MKLEVSQETEDEDRGTSAAEEIQEEKAHTFSQRSMAGRLPRAPGDLPTGVPHREADTCP